MKKNSTDSRKARAMLTVSRDAGLRAADLSVGPLPVLVLYADRQRVPGPTRICRGGFKALPQGHFLENLKNAWNDSSINIPRGMLNSFSHRSRDGASCPPIFSALTAYGLHAYHFKLKRLTFLFILLAILPVLLVYIFLSRYIVKGVTARLRQGLSRPAYRAGVFRHQLIKCCVFKECSAFGENVRLF
ncbi:MAG: hypothetical protein ACLS3C_04595 [Oscillospiraceae bacterium]